MPLESTYAPPPPKGPQYDGLVRAADDGILVDGEGFYPIRIPLMQVPLPLPMGLD